MIRFIALCIASVAFSLPALAVTPPSSVQLANTRASLISEFTTVRPGQDMHVGVVLSAKKDWHTYWENPGDAGMPTELTWTLPEGFKAGGIDWPAPEHLGEGPLLTYAYNGTVFLPVAIATPDSLKPGEDVRIGVKAEWLVCHEICVPESAELQITLPVSTDAPTASGDQDIFEHHRRIRPVELTTPGTYWSKGNDLYLALPVSALRNPNIASVQFSMREQNIINYAAVLNYAVENGTLILSASRTEEAPPERLSGILSITSPMGDVSHYDAGFKAGKPIASPAGGKAAQADTPWFPLTLLFALLGGLVLNLMPCVLPILSLKALAIAKKGGGSHEHVAAQGVAYTLGIVLTFSVLAGILLALRSGGEAVGWGYQMQSPAFVGFLIYLLFLVGLSLSGMFHLPVVLGHAGADIANESTVRGSFLTGVLATAVATPCTAPFMASAVGAALTMPAFQAMLVFQVLGLGLALPFLLISLFPALRRFLPGPGAWMDTFKQLIAFPMYASVIWLLWVLTLQTGADGMVLALCGMLLVVIVIWMKSLFADGSRLYTLAAPALFGLMLCLSLPRLENMQGSTASPADAGPSQGVEIVPYSKDKLDTLLREGKAVFVDATAAWCITCQVNARVALHTRATMALFKEKGITLMIADWTRRNDAISEYLDSFGHKGVPLCVYYPPNGSKPVVMPQVLTQDIVINTINGEP
jgi:thiol:disulfide interchange protein